MLEERRYCTLGDEGTLRKRRGGAKKEGCMKKCYNSKHHNNKLLHSTGSPPAALEREGSVSR